MSSERSTVSCPLPEKGRRPLARFALLGLLVVLAYANSFGNDFATDDLPIIVNNPLITRLDNIPTLFARDYWASRRDPREAIPPPSSGLYRPLVLTTYALNYAVGELNPFGYHLVNLLLHLLVTWLIYLVALRIDLSHNAATVAASLFAVHPLHTEAVTGVVGRAELLMSASVLGSFLLALAGARWLSLGTFLLALFSKEQAAVLPFLLAAYDLCSARKAAGRSVIPAGPRLRSALFRYGGYCVVLASYLLFRALILGGLRPPPIAFLGNPPAFLDWATRLLTYVKISGLYLWLCLWPAYLSPDYSYNAIPPAESLLNPGVLWGTLAWGSLLALLVRSYRKGTQRAWFAASLTLITYVPVSNLIVPIGTVMGERLFYLPSAGLCLLLAIGWDQLMARLSSHRLRRTAAALVGVACLALSVRTVVRNQDWMNMETLFRRAIQVVPDNAKARAFLGSALQAKGEIAEALQAYETALRLYPDYPTHDPSFSANYGELLLQVGRIDEGLRALELAVNLDPQWSALRYNLGLAYARQGRYDKAEEEWRQALALYPNAPHIHNSLSRLFIERGQFAKALTEAEIALQQDPHFLLALGNRAWALEGLGRLEEAAAGYEQMLARNPAFDDLRARLRNLRTRLNQGKTQMKGAGEAP